MSMASSRRDDDAVPVGGGATGAAPSAAQSTAAAAPAESSLRGFRLVSLCTLASRMLGMVRDVVMAAAFGAGPVLDTFSVAFRVPNLARRLFGEGAQTSAFLPAFVRIHEQSGLSAAQDLAGAMLLALGLALVALVAVVEGLLALTWWLAPLSQDARLLVELLMWLTPYLVGICLAAQQSAVLHGLRQFHWPAVLPIVLNLVWLAAIPVAFSLSGDDVGRIRWLCAAILLGGGLQFAIPMLVLHRQGFPLFRPIAAAGPVVRDVFRALGPVTVGVAITQINTVLDSLFAWGLSPGRDGTSAFGEWLPALPNGTASALYFGQRMYQFPLGLIGVALGTVLFPQLARHIHRGDREQANRDLCTGLKLTLAVGAPAGLGLMLLALPITRLLFERGAFTSDAGRLTADMIFAYGPAVVAFIGLLVLQRGYYAAGDRLTPVRHGLAAMALNLVLDVVLLFPLGAAGLAWATTIAAGMQFALAAWGLQKSLGRLDWHGLAQTGVRTAAASAAMTGMILILPGASADRLMYRVWDVALPLSAGMAVYLAVAGAIGMREPWSVLRRGSV